MGMTEQEKLDKVISGLECCRMPFAKCYGGGCPYFENEGCKATLKREALEMLKALSKFKKYFDGMYGNGFEVAHWHLNGALEPFDRFYDSAIEEMELSD